MFTPDDRLSTIALSALKNLIERMRIAADTSKAPYSLAMLLAEEHRRSKVGLFPTLATAEIVIAQASEHPDGVTTYKAVWNAFRPGEAWKANASAREVTNALDRVGFYCIQHGLPLIPTLVVNGSKGDLTDDARSNLYNSARERGMNVGPDRDMFIAEQQRLSRKVAKAALSYQSSQ
jgi:hypothetical protein